MHCIDALVSGIRGAENGFAEIYQRGTAARATWYANFNGDGGNASGADIQLDANGGEVVFVNQLVDVVVKDASGVTLRSFTAGVGASSVELRSNSFTGVNYTSGEADTAEPTNVSDVLGDLWFDSAGATDFNVELLGVTMRLQSALESLSIGVFSVRVYGAVGDGIADDTAAVAAAHTAASVSGGIVFFPPGSYRLTAPVVVGSKVSFWGSGQSATRILIDHAGNGFNVTAVTTGDRCTFRDLALIYNQNSAADLVSVSGSGSTVLFHSCYLAALNSGLSITGDMIENTSTMRVLVVACELEVPIGADGISSTNGRIICIATTLRPGTGAYNSVLLRGSTGGLALGCTFDCSLVTSGTFDLINFASTDMAQHQAVIGCAMAGPAAGTASVRMTEGVEVGNRVSENVRFIQTATAVVTYANAHLSGRERNFRGPIDESGAGVTIPDDAGVYVVRYTGATTPLGITTPTWQRGRRITFYFHNDTGGAITLAWIPGTSANDVYAAATAANANTFSLFEIEAIRMNGKNRWIVKNITLSGAE